MFDTILRAPVADLAALPAILNPQPAAGAGGPLIIRSRKRVSSWRWEGILIGRALPEALDERELLLMQLGGSRRLLAAGPDAYTREGKPVYHLTDAQRRQRERLLDRYALGWVESRQRGDGLTPLERAARAARAARITRTHNIACNGGRNNLLEQVNGVAGYSGVIYFEVGTGSPVNPTSTDTALVTPFFRKAPSVYTISGNQTLITTSFLTTEGNATYTEAGVYGSSPTLVASATLGSGVLFAHALYAYTKTSSIQLNNNYYVYLN